MCTHLAVYLTVCAGLSLCPTSLYPAAVRCPTPARYIVERTIQYCHMYMYLVAGLATITTASPATTWANINDAVRGSPACWDALRGSQHEPFSRAMTRFGPQSSKEMNPHLPLLLGEHETAKSRRRCGKNERSSGLHNFLLIHFSPTIAVRASMRAGSLGLLKRTDCSTAFVQPSAHDTFGRTLFSYFVLVTHT